MPLPRSLPGVALALALSLAGLAACGLVDYDDVPAGRFEGILHVVWVGEGGAAGDGRFVYVPDPRRPLRLIRAAPDGSAETIQPEIMYTDGGSIPRAGQLFAGFSPWGYAPAYMVHDWLFVARHCRTDATPTPAEGELAAMTFQDSAEVIAAAIKALVAAGRVRANDVAPRVISGAVAGPVSYERWMLRGACAGDRVSPEDRLAATASLPGAPQGLAAPPRRRPDGTQAPVPRGAVVASFSF